MKIPFAGTAYDFQPWHPAAGRVFAGAFAFDCETAMISDEFPWLTPPYVIGAAFDGTAGVFVTRAHAPAFFAAHPDANLVFHHATFDLAVLAHLAHLAGNGFDGYDRVDAGRVTDTLLLHKLYVLATEGHTADGTGESTLEACAARYLGVDLPMDVRDADGNEVRTSFGRWLGRPRTFGTSPATRSRRGVCAPASGTGSTTSAAPPATPGGSCPATGSTTAGGGSGRSPTTSS